MSDTSRLVEQARELLATTSGATGESAYRFISDGRPLLAGLADAVERLEAERDEAIDAHDTLIDEQRPLLTEVSDLEARVAALEAGIRKLGVRCAWVRSTGHRCKVGVCPDCELWALLDGRVPSAGQETT